LNRIDAKKVIVVGGTDKMLQSRENVRRQVLAASRSVRRCLRRLSLTRDGSFISFIPPPLLTKLTDPPHSGTRPGGQAVFAML
jgi:hypothetical protein